MGAVFERELPPALQGVLVAMADHVNEEREDDLCWPGIDHLAWKLGVSYRTVQRRVRGLEELGALRVVHPGGHKTPRTYQIDLDALPLKAEPQPTRKRTGWDPKGDSPVALKGDSSVALKQGADRTKGDGGDAKGDTQGPARATPGAEKGDRAVSPESEVEVGSGIGIETAISIPGNTGNDEEEPGLDEIRQQIADLKESSGSTSRGRIKAHADREIERLTDHLEDRIEVELQTARWADRLGVAA